MEHRTCIRSTNAQINFLINYMSSHKEFANGTSSSPVGNAQWSYLRELLKQHGPDKSIDQWKTTWRDLKRKARKQKADVCAQAMAEEFHEVPVVSGSTIKVLDTIGDEIAPECKVEIRAMKSPVREVKYVTMRRRRRLLQPPPGPAPGRDLLQAQNQRNALLQKLCDLVAEQNSILRERNQIERRKMYNRNRR